MAFPSPHRDKRNVIGDRDPPITNSVNCPRGATNVRFAFSHKELKMAKCPCRDEADVEVLEECDERCIHYIVTKADKTVAT